MWAHFAQMAEVGVHDLFPSQVNHLSRDTGLDAAQRETSEQEVAQWRQRGKLPFPDFEQEKEEMLESTLDYPPRGSPGYVKPG